MKQNYFQFLSITPSLHTASKTNPGDGQGTRYNHIHPWSMVSDTCDPLLGVNRRKGVLCPFLYSSSVQCRTQTSLKRPLILLCGCPLCEKAGGCWAGCLGSGSLLPGPWSPSTSRTARELRISVHVGFMGRRSWLTQQHTDMSISETFPRP